MSRTTGALVLLLAVAFALAGSFAADDDGTPQIALDAPAVLVEGVGRTAEVEIGPIGDAARAIEVQLVVDGATPVFVRRTFLAAGARQSFELTVPSGAPTGRGVLQVSLEGEDGRPLALAASGVRILGAWWTFLPPIIAIGLALALRQVIPALLAGVFAGAFILTGFAPFDAVLRVLDTHLIEALAEPGSADKGHLKIVLFTLLLGGMVGVIGRSGGAAGLVRAAAERARSRRSGQLTGWFAGMLIFFDDYANTLIVGPSMRPLTDTLRISREKLAFVVDATAAPIASVALISTWIGYEVGLIGDALEATRLAGTDPYGVFLASLPYRFYAWLMLGFVALVAIMGRDFGPMLGAEQRASGGEVLRAGSQPLTRTDLVDESTPAPFGAAITLGLLPIAVVAGVTFAALWATGRAALAAASESAGTAPALEVLGSLRGFGQVLGSASSYDALLYGAASGLLVAVLAAIALRRLGLADAMRGTTDGIGAMTLAVVILTLAWMIGDVCASLGTAQAAVAAIGDGLPARAVPAVIFIVAGAIAFATGSSWTTMAVLVPVALPLADSLAGAAGMAGADAERLVIAATGSVLTGAVFGDHCSPLSDTTVMSSLAAGCDHIDHVRTQIPYALLVAGIGLLVGDLAVGFGVPPWAGLLVGLALLALALRVLGRPVRSAS